MEALNKGGALQTGRPLDVPEAARAQDRVHYSRRCLNGSIVLVGHPPSYARHGYPEVVCPHAQGYARLSVRRLFALRAQGKDEWPRDDLAHGEVCEVARAGQRVSCVPANVSDERTAVNSVAQRDERPNRIRRNCSRPRHQEKDNVQKLPLTLPVSATRSPPPISAPFN
jgi:hypothetical protein